MHTIPDQGIIWQIENAIIYRHALFTLRINKDILR